MSVWHIGGQHDQTGIGGGGDGRSLLEVGWNRRASTCCIIQITGILAAQVNIEHMGFGNCQFIMTRTVHSTSQNSTQLVSIVLRS